MNVGLPREISWRGKSVKTAIFKEPVEGEIKLARFNLEGDRQAEASVHGGESKAVYAYPSEHYDYWRVELAGMKFGWGMFGENFTTEGLLEESVHVGDIFRIGSAEVMVAEPRLPCYKLGIRFGSKEMVRRFLESNRVGFYLAVIKEGVVEAGDKLEFVEFGQHQISIADIVRLYKDHRTDLELLRKVIALTALPQGWKDRFHKRLEQPGLTNS